MYKKYQIIHPEMSSCFQILHERFYNEIIFSFGQNFFEFYSKMSHPEISKITEFSKALMKEFLEIFKISILPNFLNKKENSEKSQLLLMHIYLEQLKKLKEWNFKNIRSNFTEDEYLKDFFDKLLEKLTFPLSLHLSKGKNEKKDTIEIKNNRSRNNNEELVEKLVNMGFSQEKSREALSNVN